MVRAALFIAAFVAFTILATANAGGYRYGVSDQAFYVPAISLRADPSLFPRDRDVFEPQMRLWLGDEILGGVVRHTGIALPQLFGGLYLLTMAVFVAGAIALARALGLTWAATSLALLVMTLRHRIPKTGANSLEGYMHPRMLAFAVGLFVLAAIVRQRWFVAAALVVLAAIVHTSTSMWFAGVLVIAGAWAHRARTSLLAAAAVLAIALPLASIALPDAFPRMDADWLTVLADRDYLFSLEWPLYAWLLNLLYVAAIVLMFRYRMRRGLAAAGEKGLVAGLLALVVVFVATLPATEARVAFFVSLQANRVFWLLDATLAILAAWWLQDILPRFSHRRAGIAIAIVIAAVSVGRGAYVLNTETNRTLVEPALPRTAWTETMEWLASQPTSWNVLADPGHAWKFGSSVRVAARRDTLLELGKDPAMAMYDAALARRVFDRSRAMVDFDRLRLEEVRELDREYGLDVFVDIATRQFALPVLFRNQDFVAYDLR